MSAFFTTISVVLPYNNVDHPIHSPFLRRAEYNTNDGPMGRKKTCENDVCQFKLRGKCSTGILYPGSQPFSQQLQ